jgi:pumilio family protein 6
VGNKNGRRVLLQLLAPDCPRHFPPHILQMLHPPQRIAKGGSGKSVTSIDGDEVGAGLGSTYGSGWVRDGCWW